MIYISAGHHDKDPGAVANGYKEADLTKELRNMISDVLTLRRYNHIMDKDYETNAQYQSRIKPGNASVLMDLHFNAASPSATGVEVFIASNATANSKAMANEVCEALSALMGIKNRGVKSEALSQHKKLGILHRGAGIACLVEVCFITNAKEMESYQCQKKWIAIKLADILIKYEDLI